MIKIPPIYLYFQRILLGLSDPEKKIRKKEAYKAIRRRYNIPTTILVCTFKEMRILRLMKSEDKNYYKIVNEKRSVIVEDSSKLYKTAGIWSK